MLDMQQYRESARERERAEDLLRIVPKDRRTVLDIGARDGHFSRLLTQYFTEVTALDLDKPVFEFPGVVTVAGDATRLAFDDDSFDCVFCAEVLEHIPQLQQACAEMARVAKYEIVIGVPFEQDIRVGRTTCRVCGKANPPWGHVNSFSEHGLQCLFYNLRVISRSFVGCNKERTNPFSTFLMDLAGNPWGTYNQEEPCCYCGSKLAPVSRQTWQKMCSAVAVHINRAQSLFIGPHANWIHLVLSKQHNLD
jgi:SAM-dependent methyltransferase